MYNGVKVAGVKGTRVKGKTSLWFQLPTEFAYVFVCCLHLYHICCYYTVCYKVDICKRKLVGEPRKSVRNWSNDFGRKALQQVSGKASSLVNKISSVPYRVQMYTIRHLSVHFFTVISAISELLRIFLSKLQTIVHMAL